jgi:hypothetical protein
MPTKTLVWRFLDKSFPSEASKRVIEGLLEPEPESWVNNPEFPLTWNYLLNDVCREDDVLLLGFELSPNDKAYVLERAHVERELYRPMKGLGMPTEDSMKAAYKKYWESRVPVFEYTGRFSVPQLAIWSPIAFKRLNVEKTISSRELWRKFFGGKK